MTEAITGVTTAGAAEVVSVPDDDVDEDESDDDEQAAIDTKTAAATADVARRFRRIRRIIGRC